MKKFILIMLLVLFPAKVSAVSASSYVVMDMDSGRILEGKSQDKISLIASTTKILTAITAMEYGNLEDVVTINDEVLKSYGSGIYVQIGEQLTLDDLLYGLLLRSGNDAALAIAVHVGGTVDNFVYLMNGLAAKIGMKDSSFVNPSGLEELDGTANLSTAYDMAILTKYAMQNADYKRITATKEIIVKSNYKTYKWFNKNKLLHSYIYCDGGKTGYTKKAHRTLVTTATKDGMSLIVVTFNDGNDFDDHKKLYEKYFNNYHRTKVLSIEDDYGKDIILKNDFYVIKSKQDLIETRRVDFSTENAINGSIVGKIEVLLNGEVLGYRNLYYKKTSVTKNKSFLDKLLSLLRFFERNK